MMSLPLFDNSQRPGLDAVSAEIKFVVGVADGVGEPSKIGPYCLDQGSLLTLDVQN